MSPICGPVVGGGRNEGLRQHLRRSSVHAESLQSLTSAGIHVGHQKIKSQLTDPIQCRAAQPATDAIRRTEGALLVEGRCVSCSDVAKFIPPNCRCSAKALDGVRHNQRVIEAKLPDRPSCEGREPCRGRLSVPLKLLLPLPFLHHQYMFHLLNKLPKTHPRTVANP